MTDARRGRKSNAAVRQERERLLAVVREHPEGATYKQLRADYEKATGERIAEVTGRRRLEELELEKLVERIGARRRNTLYRPASVPDEARDSDAGLKKLPAFGYTPGGVFDATASELVLSEEGLRLRTLVRRPRLQRPPVGYDPEFLHRYTPGTTWYLPQPVREGLAQLGTTAYADQPAGTYARDIMGRLIIDLSWGSSRLEGNKYSRIDTEELIKEGREAAGTSAVDRQMILNHKAAIEYLVENAPDIGFNRYTVVGLHSLLSENLLGNAEDEGRLRTRPILIGTSVYTPTAISQLIGEQFDTILAKAGAISDPLEQSFFMMVHLPYLQPFMDVNKRTSRLAANISLIQSNMCPLSFVDVPEQMYTDGTLVVYEQQRVDLLRDVFVWAYQRSCQQFTVLRQSMGEPDPIRLNYRLQLRALVTETVSDGTWPDDEVLALWAERHHVTPDDRHAFVAAARAAMRGLRPDILARYSLRLSQYQAWRDATSGQL
jgi:Fic/DOC family